MQLPPLHTFPAPQVVPAAMFPVSTQTIDPVMQEIVPALHGLAGWQGVFAAQVTHRPSLQTRSGPQLVPSPSAVPLSLQTGAPVLHAWVPVWHGFAG